MKMGRVIKHFDKDTVWKWGVLSSILIKTRYENGFCYQAFW